MTTETDTDDQLLTVCEAAAILRISRNGAYTLSRQWRANGGRVGLPCIEIGRSIRVPRSAILQLLKSATAHNDNDDGRVAWDPGHLRAFRSPGLSLSSWVHSAYIEPFSKTTIIK